MPLAAALLDELTCKSTVQLVFAQQIEQKYDDFRVK
jgi:hypothetical protein